jgi:hypothetical protein
MSTPEIPGDGWVGPLPPARPRQWHVIAAVLLFVSAGAVGALLYVQPASCGGCNSCGATSGGSAPSGWGDFAIGTPSPGGGPDNHSYQMGVTPSSAFRWGDLSFEVQTSTGGDVVPLPDWGVAALGTSGGAAAPLATYNFTAAHWTTGGSVLMTSGQTLVLELGTTDLVGDGDRLVVTLPNACEPSGSVSVSLP